MDTNICYMLYICASGQMKNGQNINFKIYIPVQFLTYEEAYRFRDDFEIRLEKTTNQTLLVIYRKEYSKLDCFESEKIDWHQWDKYKCTITKKKCMDKNYRNPLEDEEPCALHFTDIIEELTKNDQFKLSTYLIEITPVSRKKDIVTYDNQKKAKWIPVGEKLPTPGKINLATRDLQEYMCLLQRSNRYAPDVRALCFTSDKRWVRGNEDLTEHVIAWQMYPDIPSYMREL